MLKLNVVLPFIFCFVWMITGHRRPARCRRTAGVCGEGRRGGQQSGRQRAGHQGRLPEGRDGRALDQGLFLEETGALV